jgi:ribosomal protein S18 acetylase RimI-like enzyme
VSTDTHVLDRLEHYYDLVPRAMATADDSGPFTIFVRRDPRGFPYYARPRRGHPGSFTADDVHAVRARQRELGVSEDLEWVHELAPTLLPSARSAGLQVAECPLMVLTDPVPAPPERAVTVRLLDADDDDLAAAVAAVDAGFAGRDETVVRPVDLRRQTVRDGLLVTAAAYDEHGDVVGGGSHSPRGDTTELTGIAVLPRVRRRGVGAAVTAALVADATAREVSTVFLSAQDDAVARIYQRVGFRRVGTACIAAPPEA